MVLYAIVNYVWLSSNVLPLASDEATNLIIAKEYHELLMDGFKNIPVVFKIRSSALWPPLYNGIAALASLWFGFTYIKVLMLNLVYFAILLVSVYAIGKKCCNARTASLSIVLLSLYPAIFRYSRFYSLDFALTSFVALAICVLLYTENFSRLWPTLSFVVCVALGMFVKQPFAFFVIGPLLYYVWGNFGFNNTGLWRKKRLRSSVVTLSVLAVLIGGSYYVIANDFILLAQAKSFFYGCLDRVLYYILKIATAPSFLLPVEIFERIYAYIFLLINEQVGLMFFVIFIIAALFVYKRIRNVGVLFLWFFVPYCILSFRGGSAGRYMLPALPVVALVSARGIMLMKSRLIRLVVVAVLVSYGLWQFFNISFNLQREGEPPFFSTMYGKIYSRYYLYSEPAADVSYGPPVRKDYGLPRIVSNIAHSFNNETISVGMYCVEPVLVKLMIAMPDLLEYFIMETKKADHFSVYDIMYDRDMFNFFRKIPLFDAFVFIADDTDWPHTQKYQKITQIRARKIIDGLVDAVARGKVSPSMLDVIECNREFLTEMRDDFVLSNSFIVSPGYRAYVYHNKNIKQYGAHLVLSSGDTVAGFRAGRAFVLYKEEAVFDQGVECNFWHKDNYFSAEDALWNCTFRSKNKLIIKGEWPEIPEIVQVWNMSIDELGEIQIDISFEMESSIEPKDFIFTLNCGINESKASSLIQLGSLPNKRSLSFYGDTNVVDEQTLSIATMSIASAEQGDNLMVRLDTQKELTQEQLNQALQKNSLTKGDTIFHFDDGEGRIFIKGEELTRKWGLYTSILSNDTWHESRSVPWNIKKPVDNVLVTTGRLTNLNMDQTWTITLLDENTLEIAIGLEVFEDVLAKDIQANLIIGESYVNDGIEQMSYSATIADLPRRISFVVDNDSLCSKPCLGGLSFLGVQGDMLQYRSPPDTYLKKGISYDYFKGYIKLDYETTEKHGE
ncbi:ArnT family glycosyltransferase [Candidatus Omnitrophota bacterium]